MNTTPTTTFILRKTLKKEVTTLWKRNKFFFVKGFKETLSFENMHLKETHFFLCMLKKTFLKTLFEKKKKKKKRERIFENTFYIFFFEVSGPPKRKREKELFSWKKVSDTPLFFRKQFFFFFV